MMNGWRSAGSENVNESLASFGMEPPRYYIPTSTGNWELHLIQGLPSPSPAVTNMTHRLGGRMVVSPFFACTLCGRAPP